MRNPKLSSKIRMRKDLDGYILYHTSGITLLLNSVSYEILSLCDGRNSLKYIIDNIRKKYNAEINEVEDDVIKFLENFKNMGLVEYK